MPQSAPPSYRNALRAWLERHKDYPRRARAMRMEGVAKLYFVIDRKGRVLEWEIRNSSGERMLDEAVEDMIRRADPMPAMPDEMTVERMELLVAIGFTLR